MMSDSDTSDNNVLTFPTEGSIVSANGPNINISNLTGLSFRKNDLTSTMMPSIMPRNYEWQRRPWSNYNQRSMGCRRETSPMSTASACDGRQRNYNNTFYSRAPSSQRFNSDRARSPTMSLRSIDSNASAVDIVTAIKHFRGSKYDMKMIQEACSKLIKHKTRRQIKKRRNLRLFLKGYRRRSGSYSGELGSNSSMSSDDNRSSRGHNYRNMSSCRSAITDIADIRRNIKDSNMVKDNTNNFKQHKMLNRVNGSTNLNQTDIRSSVSSSIGKPTLPKCLPRPVANINMSHNQSSMNQSKFYRDRFKNGFILPSQRFNQSVVATSIPENSRYPVSIKHPTNNPQDVNSDDEEIFSELTSSKKPASNLRKRSIDGNDDICLPNNKKLKVDIAQKDFEFVKPACPVRKLASVQSKEKIISTSTNNNPTEKLISKSASLPPIQNNLEPEDEKEDNTEVQTTTSQNNTDVSMRPSFMKRKLFSQKMDITEKINEIVNSPQNSVYGQILKEKNKARKLVTSQYCLSRDINNDENNLLDLIHKIVPAEHMNATAQSSKTIAQNNKSEDKDNWDVTCAISTRNNNEEDLSDTFTDEDALIAYNGEVSSLNKETKNMNKICNSPLKNVQQSPPKPLSSKSRVKKLLKSSCTVNMSSKNELAEKNGTPTKKLNQYLKSFWDTDYESEADNTSASRKENKNIDAALPVALKPTFRGFSSMNPVNNVTMINTTVDNMQKFNNTNRIFKICSHRNNNQKITCAKVNKSTALIKPPCSKKTLTNTNTTLELTDLENDTRPVNTKPDEPKEKPKPPKKKTSLPKNQSKEKAIKKNTSNTAKEKESKIIKGINNKTLGDKNTKSVQSKNGLKSRPEKKSPPKKQSKAKAVNNNTTPNTDSEKENKTSPRDLNTISQKQKTKNVKSKTENKDELNIVQDKTKIKKGAIASLHKNENNQNKPKQTRNDKQSQNLIKDQINKPSKSQKPELNVTDKKKNKNKNNNNKINTTKLSESLIYEDTFTETNNNSIRPVRLCRLSKQNKSLDTSKENRTLNITLRSQTKIPEVKKPAAKSSNSKKQANLSDLSFLLSQKKKISSVKSKLRKAKEIDYSESDISFTLNNDKDSHLKSRGKSGRLIKQALTPLPLNKLNDLSKEPRPVRSRILTRRYFS